MAINKAILIGNLGQDPEMRYTQSGTEVCNFTVATTEKYKDKNGNSQENTEWHSIVVWGKLAQICVDYLRKGSKVYIEGKIQTRKYTDGAGVERYKTEIVARTMENLTRPAQDSGSQGDYPDTSDGGSLGTGEDVPF